MITSSVRSFAAIATIVVFAGVSLAKPARASDDPLLFLTGAPNLDLVPLPSGAFDVRLTVGGSSIPDGFPRLQRIRFDPQAVVLQYRRIDGRLRPWQRLTTSAPAIELPEGKLEKVSFGSTHAGYGVTYEFRLNYADALSWLPGGPSPKPGEYSSIVEIRSMGAKSCSDTSAATTIATAHARTTVVTVPSQPIATPDVDLRALQRTFAHRAARVVRGAPVVFSDYGSPHACDSSTPLKPGDRVEISSVDRDPVSAGPVATSVGPLGVSPNAAIPKGTPRTAFRAIYLELSEVPFAGEAATRELIFASPEEVREYLASQ